MFEYYDREKLYQEVWEAPMVEVCKRYGVSDVALAKTCKKLKVPKPPIGYWAKKAVGKAPDRPEMEPFEKAPRIVINRHSFRSAKVEQPKLVPESFEEADKLISQLPEIALSENLEDFHPFVRNTRKVFKRRIQKGVKDDYNRISVSGEDVFDIKIGPNSIERVSVILQTLCMVLKEVVQTEKGVAFSILGEKIIVQISEFTNKQEITEKDSKKYYYRDYEFIPSGLLRLEIYTGSFTMDERKAWNDTKNRNIENILNSIVPQIIRAAAWKKEYVARQKIREEEWRKEREEAAERERLARIEKRRVILLEDGYKKWQYHKELSAYVEDVKSHYLNSIGAPTGDFAKWVEWAEAYLEKNNPLNEEYPKYELPETSYWMPF